MEYDEFGNLIGGEDDDEDDYEMDGGARAASPTTLDLCVFC